MIIKFLMLSHISYMCNWALENLYSRFSYSIESFVEVLIPFQNLLFVSQTHNLWFIRAINHSWFISQTHFTVESRILAYVMDTLSICGTFHKFMTWFSILAQKILHFSSCTPGAAEECGVEEGGKHAISYQIAKNKGFCVRKKEYSNPPVKHKLSGNLEKWTDEVPFPQH